ncbi:MAG: carbohydrate ABC transporter substrate-binding protein, partial [Clostridia bacterium]|nr:carbohydrate ABC transporter substrate-binding protein [Clostridia bacterium]
MKKILALALSMMLILSAFSFASAETLPTFDSIVLGESYTDVTATIKWLTHRTDLEQSGALANYVAEFNKVYPGITVEFEGITDYAQDSLTRLTGSDDWGDIMMLPQVEASEYATYFAPYGDLAVLAESYNFADAKAFDGVVYGIPSTGNAQGIVYNKAVFEKAGITELPKTPDEFIAALTAIKEKTDAIPLYTNYAAGWTMGAWDAYIGGSATGNANFINVDMITNPAPFADNGDGTGPYAVYKILYDAVANGLIEEDYTTTDWEGCKVLINKGEIGCMVLGSWAFSQMRDAGPNGADIGYMSFPITVEGKQYASAGADYCYAINTKADLNNQIAAMVFVKWMTHESGFAYNEGGIPINKGEIGCMVLGSWAFSQMRDAGPN